MECKHAVAIGYKNGNRFIRTDDFDVPKTFWKIFFDLNSEPFEFCPLCGASLETFWEFVENEN